MLILTSTTDKIQVLLSLAVTTNQLNCVSVYRDTNSSNITPKRTVTNTNNTTAVDLVPSPSSGDSRVVDYLSIYNSDTVTSEVTIRFVDNATNYKLFKVRLSSGEKIEYQEQYGFRVITNKLSIKTNSETEIISDTNFNSVVLRFDLANVAPNDNAFIDVSELKFSVQTGKKYWFKFWINYTADATTTGSRWFLSGSSATYFSYQIFTPLTATTQNASLGANVNEFLTTSTATSASTDGNIVTLEGFCSADFDGVFFLRFATEVSGGTITIKKGSLLQYKQTT